LIHKEFGAQIRGTEYIIPTIEILTDKPQISIVGFIDKERDCTNFKIWRDLPDNPTTMGYLGRLNGEGTNL